MACSAVVTKGLNSLDYNTNVRTYLSKELFLLLKKGKNAFPMNRSDEAVGFDGAVREWLLALCNMGNLALASPAASNTLARAETKGELEALRGPVASAKDDLVSSYGNLLKAVFKAATYVPNPPLSSMMSSIGLVKPVNQYYKQVHDFLFEIQKGKVGLLDSMLERIDRRITNITNAAARAARARSNAAAAAGYRAHWNTEAAKAGLPAGTSAEAVLRERFRKLGGKRKTMRRKNKGRKTRKN